MDEFYMDEEFDRELEEFEQRAMFGIWLYRNFMYDTDLLTGDSLLRVICNYDFNNICRDAYHQFNADRMTALIALKSLRAVGLIGIISPCPDVRDSNRTKDWGWSESLLDNEAKVERIVNILSPYDPVVWLDCDCCL
jgi:hypothetical protein